MGRSPEPTRGAEGEPVNRLRLGRWEEDAVRTNARKTVFLGDLVVAAFDMAAGYSSDPRAVSLLASRTVIRVLRRAGMGTGTGQANGLSRLVDLDQVPAFEGAGLRLGPLTSAGG
jgi:hypothetical protein